MSRTFRIGAATVAGGLVCAGLVGAAPAVAAAQPETLTTFDSGGNPVVTSTGQHLIMFVSATRSSADGTSDAGRPGTVTVRLMTRDFRENHSWTFRVKGGTFTNATLRTGKQAAPYGRVRLGLIRTTSFHKHSCNAQNYTETATVNSTGTIAFDTHNTRLGTIARQHVALTHGTLVASHGADVEEACITHNPCRAGTEWTAYHHHVTLTGDALSSPKRDHPKSVIDANRFTRLAAPHGAVRLDEVTAKAPLPRLRSRHHHRALKVTTTPGSRASGKALLVSESHSPYTVACKTGVEKGRSYQSSWHGVIALHETAFGPLRVRKASVASFFRVTVH
jgi:hypothetical protein